MAERMPGSERAAGGVIAVVGELVMDMVPANRNQPELFEAAPGGSPANVAVGLARLDIPVRMGARLAGDPLGQRLRARLADSGVDLAYAVAAREPSSLAIVVVGSDGTPAYDFRVQGTADWQWQDGELSRLVDGQVVALHTGSIAATIEPGAAAIRRFLQQVRGKVTISYDPNCRPLLMGVPEQVRPRIEELVSLADMVKVSAEDLAWLLPGQTPEQVLARWLELGPALVAVTLGAEGAVAATRQSGLVRRPGRRVTVVDTVGAGDAFTSALLAGLYRSDLLGAERRPALEAMGEDTLAAVLDEAILASALTCTRHGAVPPTYGELLVPDI